jgi:hypothetical protein
LNVFVRRKFDKTPPHLNFSDGIGTIGAFLKSVMVVHCRLRFLEGDQVFFTSFGFGDSGFEIHYK